MRKIGIAGFGFMGQFHYRAYQALKEARVTALFDADPGVFERAPAQGNLGSADLGSLAGIARFTDFDRFLASGIEVVDICAPTFLHRDFTERALKSGRPVLVEKPMALTLPDCDAMIEAARAAKKLLMVAQCVRFWPGYDQILSAVKTGRFGRPLSADLRRIGGVPGWSGWFLDESRSGGAILDLLVHDFDFARAALGKPASITARGTVDALGPASGVNYCHADLQYDGGPSCATVVGGWMVGPGYPFSMTATFQFEEATLAFGAEPGTALTIYPKAGGKETPLLIQEQGYFFELRYFLECLAAGRTPDLCPPEESRDAIAMALSARDSIRAARRARA
jgi:predicted dehydrogenase